MLLYSINSWEEKFHRWNNIPRNLIQEGYSYFILLQGILTWNYTNAILSKMHQNSRAF